MNRFAEDGFPHDYVALPHVAQVTIYRANNKFRPFGTAYMLKNTYSN